MLAELKTACRKWKLFKKKIYTPKFKCHETNIKINNLLWNQDNIFFRILTYSVTCICKYI
jgi:hypothetical protein